MPAFLEEIWGQKWPGLAIGRGNAGGVHAVVIRGSYAFINYSENYENYNDAACHVHALWKGERMGWSHDFKVQGPMA